MQSSRLELWLVVDGTNGSFAKRCPVEIGIEWWLGVAQSFVRIGVAIQRVGIKDRLRLPLINSFFGIARWRHCGFVLRRTRKASRIVGNTIATIATPDRTLDIPRKCQKIPAQDCSGANQQKRNQEATQLAPANPSSGLFFQLF